MLVLDTASAFPWLCSGKAKEGRGDDSAAGARRLAEKTYVRAREQRYLSLWQIVLPGTTPNKAQLDRILNTPNSIRTVDIASFNQPIGNNIFAVVDSPVAGDVGGNLIGVVYAMGDITVPTALWSGDIELRPLAGRTRVSDEENLV